VDDFQIYLLSDPPAASRHLHDDFFVCAQGGVVHQVAIIKDQQNASMKQYIMSPWSLGF
jgi:hypothetical protein